MLERSALAAPGRDRQKDQCDGAGSAEGKATVAVGDGSVWTRFISKCHFQIS